MNRSMILVILLLLTITGCGPSLDGEDVQHIEIHYNDQLVSHIKDRETMAAYLQPFLDVTPGYALEQESLSYDLILGGQTEEFVYRLVFDLENQEAVAMSPEGIVSIPFDWIDQLLTDHPVPEVFDQYFPPEMAVYIDEYRLSPGFNQQWQVHVTGNTSYAIEDAHVFSENYRTESLPKLIHSTFSVMPPDTLSLDIIGINDRQHFDHVDGENLPLPEDPGVYRYEITALWDTPKYSGEIKYHFGVTLELSEVYGLNHDSFQPGDCMAILIENPKSLDYRIETPTYNRTIGLFYHEDDLVGLIPLDPDTTPGDYDVKVYDSNNDNLLATIPYEVEYREFEKQYLTVSSTTASLKNKENRRKDNEKFGDAKAYSVGEKLWKGTFIQPVEGRISTEYAVMRFTNGSSSYYRHNALDIAAEEGTPVMAANDGIVTFASDLIISGNVIVLDHGYGLFTSYVHLHKIHVEEGDHVTKGDVIGEVGSTGFSTGPHLHWSLWKNGVYLNPWKFIEEDPLGDF